MVSGEKKQYFKSLLNGIKISGSHDSAKDIRGNLGFLMKQLKESQHNHEVVDKLLVELHKEMELPYDLKEFKNEYMNYLRLLANRADLIESKQGCWFKLSDVETLNKSKWNMWGSYKQFMFGKCVVDTLNKEHNYNLHPMWGCLLNPTGGIVGAGNQELISKCWNSYISMHACVHDSGGYLYNYHGLGPGYNYLNTWITFFPSSSPMACQFSGLRFWKKLIQE